MLEAIDRCQRYIAGLTEADFVADTKTIDAVARNLEIIGEAAARVPEPVREAHPLVPWQDLAEIRHILIHEYHSVDPEILWRTVTGDLPPLAVMLRAVLDDTALPAETNEEHGAS